MTVRVDPSRMANAIRALAMDAVEKAKSGHPGLPMGCADIATRVVHVYEPPQVQIGAQNVCVGTEAQFSDQSITAPGNPVVQWAWDFGDGSIDSVQAPVHLYASAGTYLVSLTATTPYCGSAGVQPITVEAKPTAGFTTTPTAGCSPLAVSFGNTSTGTPARRHSHITPAPP